jgi:hypothetical protein
VSNVMSVHQSGLPTIRIASTGSVADIRARRIVEEQRRRWAQGGGVGVLGAGGDSSAVYNRSASIYSRASTPCNDPTDHSIASTAMFGSGSFYPGGPPDNNNTYARSENNSYTTDNNKTAPPTPKMRTSGSEVDIAGGTDPRGSDGYFNPGGAKDAICH